MLKYSSVFSSINSIVGIENRQFARDIMRARLIATWYKSRYAVRSTSPLSLSSSDLLIVRLILRESHNADEQQTIQTAIVFGLARNSRTRYRGIMYARAHA